MAGEMKLALVAHRGWSALFPENTLPAFAAAVSAGVDEIEFDLRLTRDEILVASHDESVDRISDLTGAVSGLSADELGTASMRMPTGGWARGLGFTRATTLMEYFRGKVGMNIHVKSVADTDAVLEAIARLELPLGSPDVYIAGSPELLDRAAILIPDLPRCCLDSSNDPDAMLKAASALDCVRVQFRRNGYDPSHVEIARRRGIVPNLFWADDLEEAERAVRSGIVGLLTNDVGPVLSHLEAVGLWTRSRPVGA